MITSLDPGDSIVIAKSFSHMLNLANLAEEVQLAYRRRIKLKKGDFADENSAMTESDIEETLKRLVVDLKKSPAEVFDALKSQTVDLVFTAHPTQSVRRSLLQKHLRLVHQTVHYILHDFSYSFSLDLNVLFFWLGFGTAWFNYTQKTSLQTTSRNLMRLSRERYSLQMFHVWLMQYHNLVINLPIDQS
jgi:hypothetical protein